MDLVRRVFLGGMSYPDTDNPFIPPADIEKPTPLSHTEDFGRELVGDIQRDVWMWQEERGLAARLNINNQRWKNKESP